MTIQKLILSVMAVFFLAGCGAPAAAGAAAVMPAAEIASIDLASLPRDVDAATAASLRTRDDVVILDVREQDEWNAGRIPGALFIPMGEIPARIQEIPTDKTVIVQCRSGNRSSQVTDYLLKQGMTNVHNLDGGINAWQAAGLPVEK
jgi:phage shock protein E